ncbi:MAG: hypothetical protein QOH61_1611 [Chloroflexota bacterium]|jgi:hypothetical protein|nr:hypothetical protein [Chloroflexota bacterium]
MSRGHGTSRRRNYGRRQSEVRRRPGPEVAVDLEGPSAWPRGRGWDRQHEQATEAPSGPGAAS